MHLYSYSPKQKFLKEFSSLANYKALFSSREWITAFLEVYPQTAYALLLPNQNYCILSINDNNEVVFCGDPFNDFNTFNNVSLDKKLNLFSIVDFLSIEIGKAIRFENIINVEKIVNTNLNVTYTKCARVFGDKRFEDKLSKRIKRQFFKYKDQFKFRRVFSTKKSLKSDKLLHQFLMLRYSKLQNLADSKSIDESFTNFIFSLWKSFQGKNGMYIDLIEQKGNILGGSLNFYHKSGTVCYLRGHKTIGNHISLGLVLDYWSAVQNTKEKLPIWDFTRGDEPYKFRLGAEPYSIFNILKTL